MIYSCNVLSARKSITRQIWRTEAPEFPRRLRLLQRGGCFQYSLDETGSRASFRIPCHLALCDLPTGQCPACKRAISGNTLLQEFTSPLKEE